MTNFVLHALIGLAVAIGLNQVFNLGVPLDLTSVSVILIASLLPDIDHNKAMIRRAIGFAVSILALVASFMHFKPAQGDLTAFAMAVCVAIAVFFVNKIIKVKHRGITHSVFAAVLFAAVVLVAFNSVALTILALVAYASHLAADRQVKLF
ncbi:MAG: metal-dependent hydrolase [Candidatus Micrarchaeota archaeon]